MAIGAYDIRFILSVQDRTRNSFTRLANDMRRLNRVERQSVQALEDLNKQYKQNQIAQREAKRAANARFSSLQKDIQWRDRQISQYKKLNTQIKKYETGLQKLDVRKTRMNAAVDRWRNAPIGSWQAQLREAARVEATQIIPQDKRILKKQLRDAQAEANRLRGSTLSMGQVIKQGWKDWGRLNVEVLKTVAAERGITMEMARQEAILERQAALRQRWRTGMDIGRSMQIRGLLMTAGASVMAQQAANFQTSATKATTQISGKQAQMPEQMMKNSARLQKDILNLMGEFPARASEMTDSAYQIFSAMNVGYGGGVKFLELFNALAVAGMTDLATATSAGITLFNNFGKSGEDAGKIMDTVFATIRLGRMEFGDFNDMLNQIAPTAAATGQSLEDIGGAAALVTSRIPSQRQSATSIARLLEVFARPDFQTGAKRAGAPITDKQGNLLAMPKIIKQLSKIPIAQTESGLNQLIPALTSLGRGGGRGITSTIQARRALSLLIKYMGDYVDLQKQVEGADNEFIKRYKVMIGQPAVQWERLKSQLQAIVIIMGSALLPVLTKLGEWFAKGLDWMKTNAGMVKWIAIVFAAVAAINLLGGVLVSLVSAFMILRMAISGVLPSLGSIAMLLRLFAGIGVITITIKLLMDLQWNKGWQEKTKGWSEKVAETFRNWGEAGGVAGGPLKLLAALFEKDAEWREENLAKIAARDKKDGTGKKIKKSFEERFKETFAQINKLSKQGFDKKMLEKTAAAMGWSPEAMERWFAGEDATSKKRELALKIADAAKDIRKQVSAALETIYTQYKTENESLMGGLFQGPWMNSDRFKWFEQFGIGPTIQDMTKDMNAQTFAFGKTRKQLDSLTKRGMPDGLMKELKAMGIDGSKYIDVLAKATGPEFKKFVNAWSKRKKELERATDKDFKRHIDKWTRQGKSLAEGLADGFSTESEHMRQVISTTIDNAFAGAIKQMAAVQVAAEQTAAAVSAAFTVPDWLMAVDGSGAAAAAKATKGGRTVIPKVYSYAPGNYQQYWGGFGNPGVMGRAGRSQSIEDIIAGSGPGLGMRGLSSTGDTHIYNITGFSPDEAYRDAERRRAFRMRNKRR